MFITNRKEHKMLKYLLISIFILAYSTVFAQSTNWNIDNSHSSIGFDIDHMVIAEVEGEFSSFEGDFKSDKDDFTDAVITFKVDLSSIDTDNQKRDDHLKSPDFFNVAEYPSMSFTSSSLNKVSGKKYKLKGNLTLHGVTKPVELDVTYGGKINDPWGNTRAGFKLNGSLNRTHYGLTWNKAIEAGGLLVGEEVRITGRFELMKAKQ